jgi:polysaccharide export outer membrane protein
MSFFKLLVIAAFVSCLLGASSGEGIRPVDSSQYLLGPDDEISVRALGISEFDGKPAKIDLLGFVDVPLVGHLKAVGLTVQQLEQSISEHLRTYVHNPEVTITVTEFKSHPVSVMGAVGTPGLYQITAPTTLMQILAQAKGLNPDAGNEINITRRNIWGPIPLPNCVQDADQSYTGVVSTKVLLAGHDPAAQLLIRPDDVVTVPKAEMVYVMGAVNKAGGFLLSQRRDISVLQAIAMAEGLQKVSSAKHSKIIRKGEYDAKVEIPVDVTKILAGKAPDVRLSADDILFIPNSATKSASLRAAEAAIQIGTGIAIFR